MLSVNLCWPSCEHVFKSAMLSLFSPLLSLLCFFQFSLYRKLHFLFKVAAQSNEFSVSTNGAGWPSGDLLSLNETVSTVAAQRGHEATSHLTALHTTVHSLKSLEQSLLWYWACSFKAGLLCSFVFGDYYNKFKKHLIFYIFYSVAAPLFPVCQ